MEPAGSPVGLFGEAGYQPSALGWPGDADSIEATPADPDRAYLHSAHFSAGFDVEVVDYHGGR